MKNLIIFSVALTLGLMLIVILTSLTILKLTLEFVAFCFGSLVRPFRGRAPEFIATVHKLPSAQPQDSEENNRRKAS